MRVRGHVFGGRTSRRAIMRPAGLALIAVFLVALGLVTGCRVVQSTAELPGRAVRAVTPGKPKTLDPVDVQADLIRFADTFIPRLADGVDALRRGTNALPRREAVEYKLRMSAEMVAVASGPNAIANLLDFVAAFSVSADAIEKHWIPEVFGDSARPMLTVVQEGKDRLWAKAKEVLTSNQMSALEEDLAGWVERKADEDFMMMNQRVVGISSQLAKAASPTQNASTDMSLFSLLMLDPFSGLDPAAREIAQTRLLAERLMFLLRQLPNLYRWQVELLGYDLTATPVLEEVSENVTRASQAMDRVSKTAQELPDQLRAEREAIVAALSSQSPALTALAEETASALDAGARMASNVQTALATFDQLYARLEPDPDRVQGPKPSTAEPFRIRDYTEAATEIDAMAQRLTQLLQTFDGSLGSTNIDALAERVGPAVQQAQTGGVALVDHLFGRAMFLVGFAALCVSGVGLILRRAGRGKRESERSGFP